MTSELDITLIEQSFKYHIWFVYVSFSVFSVQTNCLKPLTCTSCCFRLTSWSFYLNSNIFDINRSTVQELLQHFPIHTPPRLGCGSRMLHKIYCFCEFQINLKLIFNFDFRCSSVRLNWLLLCCYYCCCRSVVFVITCCSDCCCHWRLGVLWLDFAANFIILRLCGFYIVSVFPLKWLKVFPCSWLNFKLHMIKVQINVCSFFIFPVPLRFPVYMFIFAGIYYPHIGQHCHEYMKSKWRNFDAGTQHEKAFRSLLNQSTYSFGPSLIFPVFQFLFLHLRIVSRQLPN